jgi:hypothetical protein
LGSSWADAGVFVDAVGVAVGVDAMAMSFPLFCCNDLEQSTLGHSRSGNVHPNGQANGARLKDEC